MTGDLWLWLKRVCKQNLGCFHVYVPRRTPHGSLAWEECVHCERAKNWVHQ